MVNLRVLEGFLQVVDNENFRESQINIKVNLQINKDFEQNFLQFINQSRR